MRRARPPASGATSTALTRRRPWVATIADEGSTGNIDRGLAITARARIDDRGDFHAGGTQRESGVVRAVVVGEHDGAPARPHREPLDVRACRTGLHRARPVVARVGDAALDRPGRKHDLPRPDLPQALARRGRRRRRQMIGNALERADQEAVVDSKGSGTREHRDAGHVQGPRLLVAEDHSRCAVRRGGTRGGNAGRAAADDEDVTVRVLVLVSVGIGVTRSTTQTGHPADRVLVARPGFRRPHERLVIEARRNQAGEDVVQRPGIQAQRRPAVLAFGNEPVCRARAWWRGRWARYARRGRAARARSAPRSPRCRCRAAGGT